jgi:hypothetical protein
LLRRNSWVVIRESKEEVDVVATALDHTWCFY